MIEKVFNVKVKQDSCKVVSTVKKPQVKLVVAFIFTAFSLHLADVCVETSVRFAHLDASPGLANLPLLQNLHWGNLSRDLWAFYIQLCPLKKPGNQVLTLSEILYFQANKGTMPVKIRNIFFHIWLFVFQTESKTRRLKGRTCRM